jgi:nitrogen regulatory protein P-II 1
MVDKVIHALEQIGTPRFTTIDVRALGDEVDAEHLEISSQHAGTYTTMVKLEIVCAEKEVGKIVSKIVVNARTGYRGDGIVVVSPVDNVIGIRTGSREKRDGEAG